MTEDCPVRPPLIPIIIQLPLTHFLVAVAMRTDIFEFWLDESETSETANMRTSPLKLISNFFNYPLLPIS